MFNCVGVYCNPKTIVIATLTPQLLFHSAFFWLSVDTGPLRSNHAAS